jgi:hypothetical protein
LIKIGLEFDFDTFFDAAWLDLLWRWYEDIRILSWYLIFITNNSLICLLIN